MVLVLNTFHQISVSRTIARHHNLLILRHQLSLSSTSSNRRLLVMVSSFVRTVQCRLSKTTTRYAVCHPKSGMIFIGDIKAQLYAL